MHKKEDASFPTARRAEERGQPELRRSLIWASYQTQGGTGGGLPLGFQCQLTKQQEFSMLLQGDKVVKQVCGGWENNGRCSSQKL